MVVMSLVNKEVPLVKKKTPAVKAVTKSGDARTAGADDKRLGQIIRERRLEIKMSQEQLAGILGVTFQQVQKYEKGTNALRLQGYLR